MRLFQSSSGIHNVLSNTAEINCRRISNYFKTDSKHIVWKNRLGSSIDIIATISISQNFDEVIIKWSIKNELKKMLKIITSLDTEFNIVLT